MIKSTRLREWQYFPGFALWYFSWTLAALALCCLLLDKFLIPHLEHQGILAAESWKRHDDCILRLMKERNRASLSDPVISTSLFPANKQCLKKKRILVLGDSFVWGHGVANINHLWWRQLQLELERRGYNDLEVMAAGLCGATTRLELDWAKRLLPEYKPDMIIWSYVVNDACEVDEKTGSELVPHKSYLESSEPQGFAGLICQYLPNLSYHLLNLRFQNVLRKTSNSVQGYDWQDWELLLLKGRNFERYKRTIQQVAEFNKISQIPNLFVMMVFPARERYLVRLQPVEALLDQQSIPYLDLLEPMCDWYKRRFASASQSNPEFLLGCNPVNAHPGPIATHYYAEKTANLLENEYADKLGPRSKVLDTPIAINDLVPESMNLRKASNSSYQFSYPEAKTELPSMPLGSAYVQFNLERASYIKLIRVSGKGLKSASLALGLQDQNRKEFLQAQYKTLQKKYGNDLEFQVNERSKIEEILLSADISEDRRSLELKLY